MILYTVCPCGDVLQCFDEQLFPRYTLEVAEGFVLCAGEVARKFLVAVAEAHGAAPDLFCTVAYSTSGQHFMPIASGWGILLAKMELARVCSIHLYNGNPSTEMASVEKRLSDLALGLVQNLRASGRTDCEMDVPHE